MAFRFVQGVQNGSRLGCMNTTKSCPEARCQATHNSHIHIIHTITTRTDTPLYHCPLSLDLATVQRKAD